jgi:RimJ/RimL family protein N-acetyltransferase
MRWYTQAEIECCRTGNRSLHTRVKVSENGSVAGSVSSYVDEDEHLEVTYWIGKPYWGKGIATCALSAFLEHSKVRPLYARAAKDNVGSLRVLEKCGFIRIGQDKGFSNARGQEVEEFILRLN